MTDDGQLVLRAPVEDDIAFIADSWVDSYARTALAQHISKQTYFTEQRRVVKHLLATADVSIACNSSDPEHILGWVCSSGTTVHFIYVKDTVRGYGLADALLNSVDPGWRNGLVTTHLPKKPIRDRFDITYNPYLI